MQGDAEMNTGHFEEILDCWSSEEQPTAYYRTTAARALAAFHSGSPVAFTRQAVEQFMGRLWGGQAS
jgi:hypothetical protein